MDHTILQHFERAIDEDWARTVGGEPTYSAFEFLLVNRLFAESAKCRMHEGHHELLSNSARAMVALHKTAFDQYFRREVGNYYWGQKDYERLATEIERAIPRLVNLVERRLEDLRNEAFTLDRHRAYVWAFSETSNNIKLEDHPMQTFNFWIDYLDAMTHVNDFACWFSLKRSLINFVRVGNAVIPRSNWNSIVTMLPSFFQ